MRWIVLLLVACDLCARLPAPSPVAIASCPGPFVERDGHTYAVVRAVGVVGEASNLGGVHWTFLVDGAEDVLHGGGHGMFRPVKGELPDGPSLRLEPYDHQAVAPTRYLVAEVVLRPPTIIDAGWGLGALPSYTGSVVALGPAEDLAEARARLARLARTGGPLADPVPILPP